MASLRSARVACKRIMAVASLHPPRKPPCLSYAGIPAIDLLRPAQSASFSSRPSFGFTALAFLDHQKTLLADDVMFSSRRYASTSTVPPQPSLEGELLVSSADGATEMATVIPDIMAPGVSEISLAVAESSFPIAALELVMDSVHTYTGLPWWASIVATTFALRVLLLPVTIFQMKSTAKLAMVKPEMERYQEKMNAGGLSEKQLEQLQLQMRDLMKRHGVNPFAPFLGVLIQAPIFISFFFAIQTMAAKMPSLKEGGVLWFTDLSATDPYYIMPALSGLSFLAMIELNAAEGMEAQAIGSKFKNIMRLFAVALIPISASFPNAMFCYWLTANAFSLGQGLALKSPGLKSKLGIPDLSHLATQEATTTPTNAAAATYMRAKKTRPLTVKRRVLQGKR